MNTNIEENALNIIKILNENHYESYIVGGYVRDKLLNKQSNDIDICTSATPKEILKLFPNTTSPNYGSINITYKNTNFDITTFRKDVKYQQNRIPTKIKYIKKVKKDLLRRDFTINTFLMDQDKNILDLLNIKSDLDNKIIKTVGNPRYRLKEDALRILRAIRFATTLDFQIDKKTEYYIKKYKYLLKKISYQRKRQELDKIFTNNQKEKGIQLILDLDLANSLNLPNLSQIHTCDNLIGIWTQLDVDNIYPFTKMERQQMTKIREFLKLDITNPYHIYQYGLYIATVAYQIKNQNIKKLNEIYENLPIHSKKDIAIQEKDILEQLNQKPGNYLKEIMIKLEQQIIYYHLKNQPETLLKYVKENFQEKS